MEKVLGGQSQKWLWPVWSWDSKIDHRKNKYMEWTDFLHDGKNSGKLKSYFDDFWAKSKMALVS